MLKRRLFFGAIFFGLFLASYGIGAYYKMPVSQAEVFLKQFQGQTEGIGALGIFFHNAYVALIMFVPGFGIAWGSYTGWQTGATFNALVVMDPVLSNISPFLVLLSTPFGVMELLAYSIGMSRSLILILTLIKRRQIKKEMILTGIEIGTATSILLVAALVEFYMTVNHPV